MDVIDKIVERTLVDVEKRKARIPESYLDTSKELRGLKGAISRKKEEGRVPIISEIKPGSPTLGRIADVDATSSAKSMQAAGACAISVVTEPHYFFGSLENIQKARKAVSIPILRKDFMVDEYQIKESKYYGADAVLLIVSILGDKVREFLDMVRVSGLEAIVEVHEESELEIALDSGAEILGINNRNLRTLEVDLSTTKRLAPLVGGNKIIVSESGIKTKEDLRFVLDSGADAALIGTSIMQAGDIREKIGGFVNLK
ncbi:MAG: indole-3-glycerol phosphate synthase TrpC [Candidatus Altiarchaeota archaeon]|nr:indole-3-glycerol phosphate synthase TrpC [Candidatus Altiarchaeota archaeon]